MDLDYEDFGSGGMSIRNPSGALPFHIYKLTEEFRQNQLAKPQADSRNPSGSEHRYWELEDKNGNATGNHVHEAHGKRTYRGQCAECADVVIEVRDVSGPEFRGKGNPGMRGRWKKFCDRCAARRREDSLQRRSAAKRKADRERSAAKRAQARRDEECAANRRLWSEAEAADEAADLSKWAQEDREAESRHRQRRGVRSPYDRA